MTHNSYYKHPSFRSYHFRAFQSPFYNVASQKPQSQTPISRFIGFIYILVVEKKQFLSQIALFEFWILHLLTFPHWVKLSFLTCNMRQDLLEVALSQHSVRLQKYNSIATLVHVKIYTNYNSPISRERLFQKSCLEESEAVLSSPLLQSLNRHIISEIGSC